MAAFPWETKTEVKSKLTQAEAKARAAVVSGLHYNFSIVLVKNSTTYEAVTKINFHHKKPAEGKKITQLTVNGHAVKKEEDGARWHNNRIVLEGRLLTEANHLEVHYVNDYDHHGEGLHHFTDGEDKQEYLYTNFEPFEAHRLLPCFDQPDIKGKFTVAVTAPADWKVISNELAKSVSDTAQGKHHTFPETPALSTYIFALMAGPYDHYEDSFTYADGKIVPLGIYCRKTMSKFLDHQELFTITKQGLKFYRDFFDYAYPFHKYDQLFVPEFNQGAMENAGAVTFTEHYVFREAPTEAQRAKRADTVLHEMAHMWFGNLVSPVWWDGLWLNESFATYMAALAVAESTKYGALSWANFNAGMKSWAMREDQLSTTHSIQGTIADTDETFLNFDGITYGKGASVLKQLVHVLGMSNFRAGMRHYFSKFAWGNTTITDFLGALETSARENKHPIDLKAWSAIWLETPGINTLGASLDEAHTHVVVSQTAPATHTTLRTHTIDVGLFDANGQLIEAVKVNVSAAASTQVVLAKKADNVAFVFANYGDHGYFKIVLNPLSLAFAQSKLETFKEALLRQLLWQTFYNMTRDAAMKSTDYLRLVREKLGFENDPKLIQTILDRAVATLSNFVPTAVHDAEADGLFDLAWAALHRTDSAELRIIWARSAISFAATRSRVERLVAFLDKPDINGFEFDQQMRWSVVLKVIAHGLPNAGARLTAEENRDKTDRGQRSAAAARTSAPSADAKKVAWSRILKPAADTSLHMRVAALSGFRWTCQTELLHPYTDAYFDSLQAVFKEHEKEYAQAFCDSLFPALTDDPHYAHIVDRTKQLLASLGPDSAILKRSLDEHLDDLARSRACRQFAAQGATVPHPSPAVARTVTPSTPQPAPSDDSLGARATSRAATAASAWIQSTWPIIEKSVLQRADEGLFQCRMRFEDTIPQDPATQRRLVKLLRSHNLEGSFSSIEGGVELAIRWSPSLL